jgi:hypothetical protein
VRREVVVVLGLVPRRDIMQTSGDLLRVVLHPMFIAQTRSSSEGTVALATTPGA